MRRDKHGLWRAGVLILLSFLSTGYPGLGQTFLGEVGALIPPGAPGVTIGLTTAACTVSGVGIIGQGCTEIDNITIDITHTYTGDLGIFLISPGGDILELTSGNGGTGNNFTNTTFTDHTTTFITSGIAPYTGIWRPEGRQQSLTTPYSNANPLGTYTFENVFNGANADGEWTLYINDFLLVDVGVINYWAITFTGGQGPVPTVDLGPDVLICEGQSATLVADVDPSADAWEWSTGEATMSITVEPAVTTTYMVTVTNNGCMDTASVTVGVVPNTINADAGEDEEICEGQSVQLTGDGGGPFATFEWSNGQTGPSITVSPTSTTSYILTVTDGVCSGTDEVEITIVPNPIADAGPPMTMCDGMSVELDASGGTQNSDYAWSTGQNSQSIVVSPYGTTTYTVTVTVDGCEDADDVEVTVIPLPEVDAGDDETVCLGDTVLLTAAGTGGTYEWSTGETSSQIIVSPSSTTTYTVSLTDAGCTGTDAVEVEVIHLMASVTPDLSICEGDSAVIAASGGSVYLWSTGQTTPAITVSPLSDSVYSVTLSGPSGCMDEDSVSVTVLPVPVADAGPDVFITVGGMATLTATGGGTYLWSTGQMTPTIMVSPTMTTTYSVTITSNGCLDVDEVTVFVNEVPPVDLGDDLTICPGETVVLDGTVPGPFILEYQWSTGASDSIIVVAPLADSTYVITVTDLTSGFSSIDSIHVFIRSLPMGLPVIGGPGQGCLMDIQTFSASGVSGATSYTWTVMGGNLISGQGTMSVEVSWTIAGSQQVMVVAANECGALPAVTFNTNILTLPFLTEPVNGPSAPCAFAPAGYSIPPQTGASSYNWSITGGGVITSGQGTADIIVDWSAALTGTVCVEAVNDCGVSVPVCLDIVPVQSPVISAGPDLATCDQRLMLQGSGGGTWDLVSGSGTLMISDPGDPQTTVETQATGTFILVYESGAAECEASDTMMITFHPSPSINQVIEECSSDLLSYTVSFQIAGGLPPYRVNGFDIPANLFVSAPITAGMNYMFQVEDSNGCLSDIISGLQTCDCPSNTGSMDTNRINLCIGDSLIAMYPAGAMTGPGDTLAFILHDGQLPGGIIAWGFQPAFPWLASLQAGKTYFISAVSGPKGPDGFPQTGDPCFDWSLGTPFVIFEPPVVDLPESVVIGCDPQMVQLDIGGSASGPEYLYSWTSAAGGMILGKTDTTVIVAGSAGSYILTIDHLLSGCINTGEIMVTDAPVDISGLVFETESPRCPGDCDGQILVTQSGGNWLFDFGDGIFSDNIWDGDFCPGSYVLKIKDEVGCVGDTAFLIPEAEALTVDLGPDRTINTGETIPLEASSLASLVMYNWFAADTCTLCPVILVRPQETTLFQVEVQDERGCVAFDQVLVTVRVANDLYLPNVFSPNGDQINDELYIPEHPELSSMHLFEVFDRWGNLVFRATDQLPGSPQSKWDGSFREALLSPGVFTCIAEVEFRDGTSRRVVWDATLIR